MVISTLRSQRGSMALLDIVLAMVVFGIFALGALTNFDGQVQDASNTAALQDMQAIRSALQLYDLYTGSPPNNYAALVASFTDSNGKTHAPLLTKPGWTSDGSTWRDPWKTRSYGWTGAVSGSVGGATYPARSIVSAGSDKTFGTADDVVLSY